MMRTIAAAAAAVAALLAGCAQSTEDPVVFAAASLEPAFTELFGDDAQLSFDGSSGLVDQLEGGAPADVLATADQRTMDRAKDLGLIEGEPKQFAANHLVIVVPAGNPAKVTGLDASLDDAALVVCAPDVPCGAASQRLARARGVTLHPRSEETKVSDVLGKVTAGEADAGLVYLTDATKAGDAVETITVPGAEEDPNTYWIGAVHGGDADRAKAVIDKVLGDGQDVLATYGFDGPAA